MLTRHPFERRRRSTRARDGGGMRIAMVTESFLPTLNGVTTSVCRVARELRNRGHHVMILAPDPAPPTWEGIPVFSCPSVSVRQFPAGVPTPTLRLTLERFVPDVLHVASPFVLGARALHWSRRVGVPAVAIYQTDMPSYVALHGPGRLGTGAAAVTWRWIARLHELADVTLAPSRATLAELRNHGIPRTALWGRGVDLDQFSPTRRDSAQTQALRAVLAPEGETLIGYVGRLAPEKELERLAELAHLPHSRLVLVGDGPSRAHLGAVLSEAVAGHPSRPGRAPAFLGSRSGDDLANAYAAFDVFVHTGTRETFGQTLQEAAATGLPVVAPARGGPLDLIDHATTGLLFDPDRPGALAEAVAPLLRDPARRAALGAAAATAVAGRSWSALTDQLLGHYGQAMATREHRIRLTSRVGLPRQSAA